MNSNFNFQVYRDENDDLRDRKKIDRVLFIGIILVISFIPLLVGGHVTEFISPVVDNSELGSSIKGDIYTFYKYIILIVITSLLLLILFYKIYATNYNIRITKLNIMFVILAIWITVSGLMSDYKYIALHGMYNRHDGTITYLCYLALFIIAFNIEYTNKRLKWIVYSLIPFLIVNTALGLINFLGYNIFNVNWFKSLIFAGLPDDTSISEGSFMLATVNHGNYISGFASVSLVLFLTLAVLAIGNIQRILNLVFAIISFIIILTSFSSSGFITSLVIIPLILVLIIKINDKFVPISIIGIFILSSSVLLYSFSKYDQRVWNETVGIFGLENPFAEGENTQSNLILFTEGLKNSSILDISLIKVASAEESTSEEYKLPELPESGVGAGSGRLYIWEKTIELIIEKPIFGYGLDTMTYTFPQNDPEKQANLETYKVIVDKPHNFYIGIAYGSGILALITLIGVILIILLKQTQIMIKVKKASTAIDAFYSAIFIAILAFLLQYLFNDSIIGTGQVFWVFLGVLLVGIYNRTSEKTN